MNENVLVTGAYGLLGSHTVRELIEKGYHVRAFGRDADKLSKLAEEYDDGQIEVFKGDFCNPEDIESACEGMDYVIHCGALLKGWGRRTEYIRTNVEGTRNVLEACAKNNIKRLVHTSSPSAHAMRNNLNIKEEDQNENNRLNYYIESKLMAEKLIRSQDKVPYSMIRPRGITGIGDKNMLPVLINVNRQIGIPLFQKGKVLVDLVCAENAALALRLCMEKDEALGQAYNITNGEPKLVTELAEEMFTALGTKARYIRMPFIPVYALAGVLEAVWKAFRIYDKAPPLTRMNVCTLGRSQIFSIEKAKRELGYEPKVSLSEMIKSMRRTMAVDKGRTKFRYRLIYKTVGSLVPLILRKYGFRTDRISKKDEPYIVVSNHLTEVDMLMVAGAFSEHMYFVAGEHLLRTNAGPKMKWAQDPIFTYKGAPSIDTMREVIRRIRAGCNVMIFPEGSRSFNGETIKLDSGIAKLAKMAGCALATYHIEGGYFVAPRWAYTTRTGPMKGHIVNIYSSEEVKSMSREELTDCINRDIYENAYETQRRNMYKYKGERLAEGLENYLVKCSCCGAFDSMVTEDDRFRCAECGQSGRYTQEGFLEGEGLRFDSVYDWGVWSEKETCRYIEEYEGEGPVFCDNDAVLYEVLTDHSRIDLTSGEVKGFKDRLEIGTEVFDFEDISGMDMLYYGKTLVFTYKKRHLAITGEHYHAIKYQKLYNIHLSDK